MISIMISVHRGTDVVLPWEYPPLRWLLWSLALEEEDDNYRGSAKKRRRRRRLKSAPSTGKKPRTGSGSSDDSGS